MPVTCRKAAFRWQLVAYREAAGLPKASRVPVAPPRKRDRICGLFLLARVLFMPIAGAENHGVRMTVEVSFVYLHAHFVAVKSVVHDMFPAFIFASAFVSNGS